MRSHRFLEDIAIADTAFEAKGNTPQELFLASADALFATMVDPSTVIPRHTQTIQIQADDLSELLYQWLNEIVYLKDANAMVFCEADVTVKERPTWALTGHVCGDNVQDDHLLGSDVKAVTKHMYDVSYDGSEWVALVVLDI